MDEERMRVLGMLEKGQISAAEAAELLRALGGRDADTAASDRGRDWSGARQGRWFRVRVTDRESGRERANFAVPLGMLNFPFGMAHGFGPWRPRGHVGDILEALHKGHRGTVFDVSGGGSEERVEISIE